MIRRVKESNCQPKLKRSRAVRKLPRNSRCPHRSWIRRSQNRTKSEIRRTATVCCCIRFEIKHFTGSELVGNAGVISMIIIDSTIDGPATTRFDHCQPNTCAAERRIESPNEGHGSDVIFIFENVPNRGIGVVRSEDDGAENVFEKSWVLLAWFHIGR